jgi:hypothetical protein
MPELASRIARTLAEGRWTLEFGLATKENTLRR